MRINSGRATYSHFSTVAQTDEAMLLPAGKGAENKHAHKTDDEKRKSDPDTGSQGQKQNAEHHQRHQPGLLPLNHFLPGFDGLIGLKGRCHQLNEKASRPDEHDGLRNPQGRIGQGP